MSSIKKDLFNLVKSETEKVEKIAQKETFDIHDIKEISKWESQALMLLETFKKTDSSTYLGLKDIFAKDITLPSDIRNAIRKFKGVLEYIEIEFKEIFDPPPSKELPSFR